VLAPLTKKLDTNGDVIGCLFATGARNTPCREWNTTQGLCQVNHPLSLIIRSGEWSILVRESVNFSLFARSISILNCYEHFYKNNNINNFVLLVRQWLYFIQFFYLKFLLVISIYWLFMLHCRLIVWTRKCDEKTESDSWKSLLNIWFTITHQSR